MYGIGTEVNSGFLNSKHVVVILISWNFKTLGLLGFIRQFCNFNILRHYMFPFSKVKVAFQIYIFNIIKQY